MTTKEQERKALEQIRKIVAGLGENSYIGTAFEGCFEIAAQNIDNDWACSMKERKEAAEFAEDELRTRVADQAEQIKKLHSRIDNLLLQLSEEEKALDTKDYRIAELDASRKEISAQCIKHWNDLQAAEAKLDEKEEEITRLKAKLYDLLTK